MDGVSNAIFRSSTSDGVASATKLFVAGVPMFAATPQGDRGCSTQNGGPFKRLLPVLTGNS